MTCSSPSSRRASPDQPVLDSNTVAPGSDRVRIASLALQAALGVDGVTAADQGPQVTHVTVSGSTVIHGVRVVAESPGRFSVDLGLRARLVPLHALADAVRSRVDASAAEAGLGERVGATTVTFHEIEAPTPEFGR